MKTKNILFGLLFVLGFGASSCEDKSDDNLTETKVYISKSGDISIILPKTWTTCEVE